ncbi:MAG: YkvA family protein [Geitlerinemataceae cyanobacterium]
MTIVEETDDPARKSAETWLDRVRPKQLEDRLLEQYRQFQQQRQAPPAPADLGDETPDEKSMNPFERVWANLPNLPDRADIERRFEKLARNAKPEDIGKIIKRLPEMNRGPIRELWPKVRSLFEMIRDPQAAWSAKALAIGALIYLISPLDAIPDFIPFAGLADDAALIVAVVAALARELDRYVRQSMEASVETAEKLAEIEVRKYNRIVRITLLGSIATALITIGLKLWLDAD